MRHARFDLPRAGRRSPVAAATLLLAAASAACGGSAPPAPAGPAAARAPAGAAVEPAPASMPRPGSGREIGPPAPPPPPVNAPEISRSVGPAGGVIVLWPRVSPRGAAEDLRPLARALQRRLRELAERTLPGRPVEERPEPERVCPRQGCTAAALGAVLARGKKGCVALALVSAPGAGPARLVPWAGEVALQRDTIPFREPPEAEITVADFTPCDRLLEDLGAREAEVAAALRAATR